MNATVAVDPVQYAERIRRMLWADMMEGRVPTGVADLAAVGVHVDVEDYLRRAGLPSADVPRGCTGLASTVTLVDEWIRNDFVRFPYGAFTVQDASLLTGYLHGVEQWQRDVGILARIAGEWLAGVHATVPAEEYSRGHGQALLALAHDVLAR